MNNATITRCGQLVMLVKIKKALLDMRLDQLFEDVDQGKDGIEVQIKLRDVAAMIDSCTNIINR